MGIVFPLLVTLFESMAMPPGPVIEPEADPPPDEDDAAELLLFPVSFPKLLPNKVLVVVGFCGETGTPGDETDNNVMSAFTDGG